MRDPSARRSRPAPRCVACGRTPFGYRGRDQPVALGARGRSSSPPGQCDVPAVPAMARACRAAIHQITPVGLPQSRPAAGRAACWSSAPRRPACSSRRRSGSRAGRSSLAVGRHTRLPRRYRGRDIMVVARTDRRARRDRRTKCRTCTALARSRRCSSSGGRTGAPSISARCGTAGVRMLGRAVGVDGQHAASCRRPGRDHRRGAGGARTPAGAHRHRRRRAGAPADGRCRPPLHLPLPRRPRSTSRPSGIRTVVWATGYRRELRLAARSRCSMPRARSSTHGGITPSPGLYVLGLRFLRRRRSHFIDGVGTDAEELARTSSAIWPQSRRAAA